MHGIPRLGVPKNARSFPLATVEPATPLGLTFDKDDIKSTFLFTGEVASHCGRLAAVVRCLLAAHPDNRAVVETLAQAALDSFDEWQAEQQ